jgi:hypothetical protein
MTTQTIALFFNNDVLAALAAIVAAIGLVAAITYGARRWQTPGGKAITIIAGSLLLILAAGAAFLLFLAKAMEHGNTL